MANINHIPCVHMLLTCTKTGGVSAQGEIPWIENHSQFYMRLISFIKKDQERNCLIVGRNTYEKIKGNLLEDIGFQGFIIVVTSRDLAANSKIMKTPDLERAVNYAKYTKLFNNVYIIGGIMLLREAFKNTEVDKVLIFTCNTEYECDRFIDMGFIKNNFSKESSFENIDLGALNTNSLSNELVLLLRNNYVKKNSFLKTLIYISLVSMFILPFITTLFNKR